MKANTLAVEINKKFAQAKTDIPVGAAGLIMITPPIDEDYWLLRVRVSSTQAIVAFPKFGTIGIGFQREEDWNTNLPYKCDAVKIYEHIRHNKGDKTVRREKCIAAIRMIQEHIAILHLDQQAREIYLPY